MGDRFTFGNDGVDVFGPDEGLAAVVVTIVETADDGDVVFDDAEGALVNGLTGDDRARRR